jgi:AraC-like DNA-binding protein
VPPDGRGSRTNPDLSAILLIQGWAKVRLPDGLEVVAREGQWLFVSPGDREQDFSPDARILSLTWRARWPDGRPLFARGLPVIIEESEYPGLRTSALSLLKLIQRHYANVPLPEWRSRASARIPAEVYIRGEIRLLDWLGHVIRALASRGVHPAVHDIPDDRLLAALELMESVPLRRMQSVPEIALRVGLSASQLKRLFILHVGHSPSVHLRERTLREAYHLLGKGDLPIKEVAYLLGFPSQSAFYNWFKKHSGIRPGAVPPAKPLA